MAGVRPQTLTVTITETLTLAGSDRGSTHTQTLSSMSEQAGRIVPVPTSEIIVLAFAATVPGPGAFNEADVRYIRLTNKDADNFISLKFRDEDGTEFGIKLEHGASFIYGASDEGVVDTMVASGSALADPPSFADLVDITARADTAACDLEYFVAGT